MIALVIQQTFSIIFIRYSMHQNENDEEGANSVKYLKTTAVVVAELIKVAFSIVLFHFENGAGCGIGKTAELIFKEVFVDWRSTLRLAIPAMLYTLQNNTIFVALNNLPGLLYQISSQGKIFTTAIFSVILLKRKLSCGQWAMLFLLASGVVAVQYRPPAIPGPERFVEGFTPPTPAPSPMDGNNVAVGMAAVVIGVTCSGAAGTYFELVLKGTKSSLWIRNIQLGLMSAVIGTVGVYFHDGVAVAEHGFLGGYNNVVWATVTIHGIGGLLVAMVIKYADAIIKGFASAISSCLTGAVGVVLLDEKMPGPLFLLGGAMVLGSSYLYTNPQIIDGNREVVAKGSNIPRIDSAKALADLLLTPDDKHDTSPATSPLPR